MIRLEELLEHVAPALRSEDGEVFHSGRSAFEHPEIRLYLLGINPGKAKSDPFSSKTIQANIDWVCAEGPNDWSAHAAVLEQSPSEALSFQHGINHLFRTLRADPCRIPASNLIFHRSGQQKDLKDFRKLAEQCWPFHQAVIRALDIQVIVCLGGHVARFVSRKLRDDEPYRPIETFVEGYEKRRWKSHLNQARTDQPLVAGLTHPGRAHWTQEAADPTDLVVRALGR